MHTLDITADVTKGPDGRASVSASGSRQMRAHLDAAVRPLDVGDRLTVRFRQGPKLRTGAQNRLYRGPFLGRISLAYLDAGRAIPTDALHLYFKGIYLPAVAAEVERETGEVLDVERPYDFPDGRTTRTLTTTQLTVGAFSLYLDRIMSDDDVLAMGVDFSDLMDEARSVRSGKLAETDTERLVDYSDLHEDAPMAEPLDRGQDAEAASAMADEYLEAEAAHRERTDPISDEPFGSPAGSDAARGPGPHRTFYDLSAGEQAEELGRLFGNGAGT